MIPHVIVVPVKSNSARCYRKNFRSLGGKALWRWTVDEVSKHVSTIVHELQGEYPPTSLSAHKLLEEQVESVVRVFVVLDDPKEWGFDSAVEFVPRTVGDDAGSAWDVALRVVRENGLADRPIVLCLPTSPFRTASDITRAVNLYEQVDCPVLSGVEVAPNKVIPGQFSETLYLSTGGVQVACDNEVSDGVVGRYQEVTVLPLESDAALDIDTEDDWALAEWYVARRREIGA